jgi:CheY-like chemotaxis protein
LPVTGTVLVADDSPTIQNKAKGILTGEGLEVITVSNGVAAIKKLPQVMPLLILADVAMPGRDGYEVCDFVKHSPDLNHIPVVLIFSDADPYSEEQGARVHADGKIRKMVAGKPFIPEELISAVTGFLTQAESRASSPSAPAAVTEPADEWPGFYAKKGPDFSALPKGDPFADPAVEEVPSPTWSGPASSPSTTEAETTFSAAPADELATEAAPPPLPARSGPDEEAPEGHEPQLIEEAPAVAPPPVSRTQRTILFRNPADIAEPLLHDELATPPPAPPSAPAEPPHSFRPATPPGSFFPANRTTPEARSSFPEPEPVPESFTESPDEAVEEAVITSGPDTPVDTNLVHSIVQKVVAKMSPPALSQEVIDDMAQKLAGEIIAEIIAESS